jgi:hypothetical protein
MVLGIELARAMGPSTPFGFGTGIFNAQRPKNVKLVKKSKK